MKLDTITLSRIQFAFPIGSAFCGLPTRLALPASSPYSMHCGYGPGRLFIET
jgi:hypothetical protein